VDNKPAVSKTSYVPALFLALVVALLYVTHPFTNKFILRYPSPPPQAPISDTVKLAMQIVISLGFGAASLFIVVAKRFGPKDKHWAYGMLGTILGFWLR
jgi:hypothetical protein